VENESDPDLLIGNAHIFMILVDDNVHVNRRITYSNSTNRILCLQQNARR
jgi:hypothetical protein